MVDTMEKDVGDIEAGTDLKHVMPSTSTMFNPIHLQWKELGYTVKSKKGEREILNKISGEVRPGSMLAIMGSSGAGKTTLLNLLAGRLSSSKNVDTAGDVYINGEPRDFRTFGKVSAYVEQSDNMFEALTVKEQIKFSADLRLPSKVSKERREAKADEIITELGLKNVKDSKIGGESVRGVSGGEKRRVNIGTELVTSPSLVFLDEPTSGLDSFNAMNVMQSLRELAERGRTIVTTIHQPRSNIYALFDQLLLLSRGEVMYFGPAKDAVSYFSNLGYPCPPSFNPADFLIDLVSSDTRTEEKEAETNSRLEEFAARHKEHVSQHEMEEDVELENSDLHPQDHHAPKYNSSWGKELYYLLRRTAILRLRDTASNITRIMIALVMGILLGLIWLNVGRDYWNNPEPVRLQALIGVLAFVAINESFNGAFAILFTFPMERTITLRERASRTYRVSTYFLAKTIVELPGSLIVVSLFSCLTYWMVGFNPSAGAFFEFIFIVFLTSLAAESLTICIATFAKDAQVTSSIVPVFIILSFLFSNFLIDLQLVDGYLRWLQYLSWIRYALVLIMYSQFQGDPNQDAIFESYADISRAAAYGGLMAIIVVLRVAGYVALRINKPKKA